jgi:hypothetical protein
MPPTTNSIAQKIAPSPKPLRYFFFVSGIVATIAYRIIFLLDPLWVKIVWYVGTIGFILYFWHRAHIEDKRAKLVKEYDLVNVIETSDIQGDQKSALSYLIKTSLTSKAKYNSAFIVIASLLALIVSAAIDIYHLFM